MSDIWSPPGNERPSLRLQLEQMLKSDTPESDCASSPPGAVVDSIHGDDLVQFEDDPAEGEAPLANESDGEADEDWAAQMMDTENVIEEDQRPNVQSVSGPAEDPSALALSACHESVTYRSSFFYLSADIHLA